MRSSLRLAGIAIALSSFSACLFTGIVTEEEVVLQLPDYPEEQQNEEHEDEEERPTEEPHEEEDDEEPVDTWGDHDLSCSSDSDCLDHETCVMSTCQVDRCSGGDYQSPAPLGDSYIFYADLEFAILDHQSWNNEYWIDGYSPGSSSAPYESSWSSNGGAMNDIAGGNFLSTNEEGYAAALSDAPALAVLAGGSVTNFILPFVADSIAAGDVDTDGSDDIAAIDGSRLALCTLATNHCESWQLDQGAQPIDIALGDVDGDDADELVLLIQSGGRRLFVLNEEADLHSEQGPLQVSVDQGAHRVDVADLDGDGRDEIVVLEEGGWFNLNDDELSLYRLENSADGEQILNQIHHEATGYSRLLDLSAGDTDSDESAEIVVLDDHDKAVLFRFTGSGLSRIYEQEIQVTQDGQRIAMADQDNNSPRAVLQGGPSLEVGASVPIVAMLLPPYSYEHSAGFSSTGYGLGETFSESYSDTVSLSLNADVGVKGSFLGLFAASFSEKVSWKTSKTLGNSRVMATGGRSSIRSQPEDFGFSYGAVVVSWGCFHAYTYEISDPSGLVPGSDAEEVVLTVPVDGGTAMLSTGRYNAIAQAVGDLPIIDAPYRVGDPRDYPREPETIYGDPIPEDAYVFPDLSWYEVSDVGYVGWFNTLSNSNTESSHHGMDMGVSANITVSGVSVGMGLSSGWGKSYSLTLGESAMFNGGIPPFVDDPSTEADEYVENFFRVAPITYMQDYTDSAGNEAAFYVSTFIVDID